MGINTAAVYANGQTIWMVVVKGAICEVENLLHAHRAPIFFDSQIEAEKFALSNARHGNDYFIYQCQQDCVVVHESRVVRS